VLAAKKSFVEELRVVEKLVSGVLVGQSVTIADIALFSTLLYPFQLFIDAGVRKAVPKLTEWFTKVSKLEFVVKVVGKTKLCAKSLI
jgi:glutathione S-transferase